MKMCVPASAVKIHPAFGAILKKSMIGATFRKTVKAHVQDFHLEALQAQRPIRRITKMTLHTKPIMKLLIFRSPVP